MALMADDGLARAITPSHTVGDGDTVFSLATGRWDGNVNLSVIGALAADAMAEAIVRAATEAERSGGLPSARDWGPYQRAFDEDDSVGSNAYAPYEPASRSSDHLLCPGRRHRHLDGALRSKQQRILRRRPQPRPRSGVRVNARRQHRRGLHRRRGRPRVPRRHQRVVVGGIRRHRLARVRRLDRSTTVEPRQAARFLYHRRLPRISIWPSCASRWRSRSSASAPCAARRPADCRRNHPEHHHGRTSLGRRTHRRRHHDDLFRGGRTSRLCLGEHAAAGGHACGVRDGVARRSWDRRRPRRARRSHSPCLVWRHHIFRRARLRMDADRAHRSSLHHFAWPHPKSLRRR